MISGQNAALASNKVSLMVQGAGDGVGLFVTPLHSDKTISGQIAAKNGVQNGVSFSEKVVTLELDNMHEPRYLVSAISLTGTLLSHLMSGKNLVVSSANGAQEQTISIDFTNTNAFGLEMVEVYKHNGVWKIRCLMATYGLKQDFLTRFQMDPLTLDFSRDAVMPQQAPTPATASQAAQGGTPISVPANMDEARETASKLMTAGKGWLQRFASASKDKAEEVKTEALKFKSESFLQAVVGGGVLMGYADGEMSGNERDKLKNLIVTNSALSVYDEKDLAEAFDAFNAKFSKDFDIGELSAFEALRKIRGSVEKSEFILQLVISIGASDGNFDQDERRYAKKIAYALDVEPSKFDL